MKGLTHLTCCLQLFVGKVSFINNAFGNPYTTFHHYQAFSEKQKEIISLYIWYIY